MKNNFWTFFSSSLLLTVFFNLISPSFCTYKDCSAMFNCGEIVGVGFPFWGEDRPANCGVPELKLTCDDNVARIEIVQVKYRVLQVNPRRRTVKIARDDYWEGVCPETTELKNTTVNPNVMEIMASGYVNMTLLYGCDWSVLPVPTHLRFGCGVYGDGCVNVIGQEMGLWRCNQNVVIPVRADRDGGILVGLFKVEDAIREGFEVRWKVEAGGCGAQCVHSGGVCGFDSNLRRGTCFCQSASSSSSPV